MKKVLFINAAVLLVLLSIVTMAIYWAGLYKLESFYKTDYYQSDSLAVFTHQPNYRFTFDWTEHPRGEITFQTNNLGFRNDEDSTIPKKENEVRILITGDSHIDGVVYNEESLASVLQEKLNEQAAEREEDSSYVVLNGGHGFYSFKNYYGLLQKYQKLGLDHFIVVIFNGNDFRETLLYEEESKRFGNVMQNMIFRLKRKIQYEIGHDIPLNQGIDQEYYFWSNPGELSKAMQTAQEYMSDIKEFCSRNNIGLTVALLPSKTESDPVFSNYVEQELELPKALTKKNEELTEEFINRLEKENFTIVDLSVPLGQKEKKKKMYWDRDLHINHHAHEAIGEYLFEKQFLKK